VSAVLLYLLDAHQAAVFAAAPRRRESAEDEDGDEEQDRVEAEVLALADRLRNLNGEALTIRVCSPDLRTLYFQVVDGQLVRTWPVPERTLPVPPKRTGPPDKLFNGKPFSYGPCAQEDCSHCGRGRDPRDCALHCAIVDCPECHGGFLQKVEGRCGLCLGRGAVLESGLREVERASRRGLPTECAP
jgi:hypothetical protein